MKKLIVFLIFLCSSLLSFSQREITNKSHPFQVLFVEDVTIFGREVRQYDYLNNSDLLNVKGSITLFHFTGEMIELSTGSYWTDELINNTDKRLTSRPLLNPNESENFPVLGRIGKTTDDFNEIDLVIPSDDKINRYWDEIIELGWVLDDVEDYKLYSFEISFLNIFNEVVRKVKTKNNFFTFKSDTLDYNKEDTIGLDDGLLIVRIKSLYNQKSGSGEYGLRLVNKREDLPKTHDKKNYDGLLDAIYLDYLNENSRANFLYREQVRKSNQDPRFIQLYEDFLDRNPEFK